MSRKIPGTLCLEIDIVSYSKSRDCTCCVQSGTWIKGLYTASKKQACLIFHSFCRMIRPIDMSVFHQSGYSISMQRLKEKL